MVLAVYLLSHFLHLLVRPAEHSSSLAACSLTGIALSILLAIGLLDRAATLGLGCLGVYLFGHDPLLSSWNIVFLGVLLLLHILVPPAPYGSWAARGRIDPGGNWRMPPALFAAVWITLALSYTYSGYDRIVHFSARESAALWIVIVLDLSFAPLALIPCLRPWLWAMMLLMHPLLLSAIVPGDLLLGLMLLHLLAFDPGWIRPKPGGTERIFYDGHCGLCQRSVRLILAEDATATAFRFAPLQGETFAATIPQKEREALPLSMVVQTADGTLLTRSKGVLHILRRLGGLWRLLAGVLSLIPPALRDSIYDGVALIRHHVFARPEEICPLMPPHLRERFDP